MSVALDLDVALFDGLCRLGDSTLVLGHRVSEWCGHAPVLEEDIALANVALDLIGQTQLWLGLAAEVEGKGRDADALAFRRDVWDFRNLLLVERPNGDFGHTLMRQFLFDAWHQPMLKALEGSSDPRIAAIAAKAGREVAYHLERSADLVIRLGDGTAESHARMQTALDRLWPYTGEMMMSDDTDRALAEAGIMPAPDSIRPQWDALVAEVLSEATLKAPNQTFMHKGGKQGTHSEHLGHMLATMQWLQRAYPDSTW
jgi:ring-1,2-phenylacetyl-CoA epoxidase subunit PaaC